MPDYSQYVAVKKIRTAQTANANTSIIKGRAPYIYDGYFPLYRSINLPVNALLSNKFTSGTGGAVAPTFIPTDISTCQLWLDAADTSSLTLSGSTVTQWRDKTVNSRHLNQNTGATFSNNSLVFNGSQSYNAVNTGGLLQNVFFGIFVVEKVNTGGYLLGDNSLNGNGASLAVGYNNLTNLTMSFFFSDLNVTSISGSGVTRLWSFILPSSGNRFINLNGSLAGTFTNNTYLTAFSTLRVGGVYGGTSYNGSIYEILIYVGNLTTTERQQIEGYLAWKWGLQSNLPAGHLYKLAKP